MRLRQSCLMLAAHGRRHPWRWINGASAAERVGTDAHQLSIASSATRSKACRTSATSARRCIDLKQRYPDRKEVAAIIYDETKRNPQTVMMPFGRNLILTNKEIEAIVDYLYAQ